MKELLYYRPVENFPEEYGVDPKPSGSNDPIFGTELVSRNNNLDNCEENQKDAFDEYIIDESVSLEDDNSKGRCHNDEPAPKRKRKSYSAALSEFSESFFSQQKQLNNEFIAEQKTLIQEEREYDNKIREEDRIFFQTLLMHTMSNEKK